jgi:hypothetical protein
VALVKPKGAIGQPRGPACGIQEDIMMQRVDLQRAVNEEGDEGIDCLIDGGLLDEDEAEVIVSSSEIRPIFAIEVGSLLCDSELAERDFLHESDIEISIIDVQIAEDVPGVVLDRFGEDIPVLLIHLIEESNDYCGVFWVELIRIHVVLGLQDALIAGAGLHQVYITG